MKIVLRDNRTASDNAKRVEAQKSQGPVLIVGNSEATYLRTDDANPRFLVPIGDNVYAFTPNRLAVIHSIEFGGTVFRGTVLVRGRHYGFLIHGIDDKDEIRVSITSRFRVNVEVKHWRRPPYCRAECPDGTSGSPCVECALNGGIIRVCC